VPIEGRELRSWGYIPDTPQRAVRPEWQPVEYPEQVSGSTVLPFGNGRSYGDSCLNSSGILIDMRSMNRFIAFDREQGVLTAQPGVLLRDVLDFIVPAGWFLPVSPGTSQATLGGALANDVHGKNHHRDGTFGCFVERFSLLRSDGGVLECSRQENTELFAATIGGLGLTGLVTELTIELLAVNGPHMDVRYDTFTGLGEFAELSLSRKHDYQYTVAWLDCASGGSRFARGVFMSANHLVDGQMPNAQLVAAQNTSAVLQGSRAIRNSGPGFTFPFNLPKWALNSYSIKAFNSVYYGRHRLLDGKTVHQHYQPFFYPLDAINRWNRIYGVDGFHQYQFVVPLDSLLAMEQVLQRIVRSGMGSFLAVLKEFGSVASPGLLSFPREGYCLALDFANRGNRTRRLIQDLDKLVLEAGGAVYPAKDRLMSKTMFQSSFPEHEQFARWIDPGFSSDFWERVNAN